MTFQTLQKILPRLYSFLPYYLGVKAILPPAHVFFEVTYRCNLRCEMCHFLEIIEDTETNRKFKQELSAAKVRRVIDQLPRFSLITFTGGEAFMKSDILGILDHAAKRHKVHIITNGTLLTPKIIDFLVSRRVRYWVDPGIFYLGVSLEGFDEVHDRITGAPGSFAKSISGLERLLAARAGAGFPKVHVTCVIADENVDQLADLYDMANGLGVDVMNFVLNNPAEYPHYKDYDLQAKLFAAPPPVKTIDPDHLRGELDRLQERQRGHRTQLRFSPNGVTRDEIVRYYSNQSSYKDYRCFTPWSKVAVSAYGDVFSCPHVRWGNLDDHGGSIPWLGKAAERLRHKLRKNRSFPGCLGCCQSEYVGPARRETPALSRAALPLQGSLMKGKKI